VDAVGRVIALAYLPHAWKFLYAPVVDATLTRRTWYLISLLLVAGGTAASITMPITVASLPALTLVVMGSQLGLTLMGMACEACIGHTVTDDQKGRASAWYQGGAYVGLGVGGGAILWLVQHVPSSLAAAIVAGTMLLAGAALLGIVEPPRTERVTALEAARALGRDLKALATSRAGIVGLLICVSPVGSGAASSLFAAIASEWGANEYVVELVNGALGGVTSGVGSLLGVFLLARMNRKLAYALAGSLSAVTAVVMAAAPHVVWAYIVFTLLYQAFNGLAFAAFSAFVFDTIGRGAVATKYNVFASLVNISIVYATRLDGRAHVRWKGSGVLLMDAGLTAAGIVVLAALVLLVKPRRTVLETRPRVRTTILP
jgi:MFS family permease